MVNLEVRKGQGTKRDPNSRVRQQCREAQGCIDAGDYVSARESLSDVWRRVGERPDLKWLDENTSAEVLLRVGVLTGCIGSSSQIPEAQEHAKNLISEAIEKFTTLGDNAKIAESQIDLSICYWREGAFDEARVVVDNALQITSDQTLRARALVNKSTIAVSCGDAREALEYLDQAAPLLSSCDDHPLLGRFHNQHALVLRKTGISENLPDLTDRALIEYAAASSHFELAGDQRYQGAVETNLGNTYLALGRPDEALDHLDHARLIFTNLRSHAHIAQVDEARAQVYLSQGQNADAEVTARTAVSILREGDEAALLAEALTTHGCALARLNAVEKARTAFMHAISAAERAGDISGAGKACISIIEELHEHLSAEDLQSYYGRADDSFTGYVGTEIIQRLRACVRHIIEAGQRPTIVAKGETLHSAVRVFEKEMVKRALISCDGTITKAARMLGLTHQGLTFMLDHRHQDLVEFRKEKRTRRRSLLTKKRAKRLQQKTP